MRYQKSIVITAVCALLVLSLGVAAVADEKYEEKFNKTESIAPDGKVKLTNISGDVWVRTWDKAEVQINALKTAKASSLDKAKENAQLVKIEVTKADGGLEVIAKYPEGTHKHLNVSVNFDLMIPAKAALAAITISGDVKAEKIGGALKVATVSGDVTVMGAAKGADAKSVSGDVTMSDVTGDVYLNTVSGDVKADRIKGSISSETVSGNAELSGISEAKTVSAKVLSGDVTYQGKLNKEGRYTFKTHSGNVEVTIPADSAFEFSAETFSGDISTDFKVEVSGKLSKKELHGTVNGGGAVLNLASFSGDIDLKKI
ncbi:MAG: DUF4097 family beta strand repeat-containing protein [Candidatus Aminicenantes bacterium]|nr:DUF4097 family beta strand repeat-containing protein [Candidatus Aminicenantes bacterium]